MKNLVLAANWKMNLRASDIEGYFARFAAKLDPKAQAGFIFAVPSLFFERARQAVGRTDPGGGRGWRIAAQNCHEAASGAFTGELSLPMLSEAGIQTALIGHSERRQHFGETDVSVGRKVRAAGMNGFLAVACVGETKEERLAHKTIEVVSRQVRAVMENCLDASRLIIAYEPVWAIGTGLTASAAQAGEVHDFIRGFIGGWLDAPRAKRMPILYGGSVKPENIAELVRMDNIDGALVGGASLEGELFAELANRAMHGAGK